MRAAGVLLIVAVLFWAAIFLSNTYFHRREPPEASGVGSLRSILAAEMSYRSAGWKSDSGTNVGYSMSLEDLGCKNPEMVSRTSACLIDNVLAHATSSSTPKSGYYYEYQSLNGGKAFTVNANPARPRHGSYYFFTDATGVIRFTQDRPATVNDSPLQ